MSPPFKIGVDGGGSKTECILLDAGGDIIARHVAPGSNPSIVGPEQARTIVAEALVALRAGAHPEPPMAATLLCMAGNPAFWREFAATLAGFGQVTTTDDSLPVLELATQGHPGLVLHAGTGSFVAARSPDGAVHYAGGRGWRFGDPGSGYDIGRRAIARGLLELQGWAPPSRLGPLLRDHAQLAVDADAATVTRYFYHHPEPNRLIASLAPALLRLAREGDPAATTVVIDSAGELLDLAAGTAAKLFPGVPLDSVPAGLSGPILTQELVIKALTARTPLTLTPVEGAPIDGVRQLLLREA